MESLKKMKLKKLLQGISTAQVRGSKEIEIIGLCNNSKKAAPGHLFFAKKGKTQDGCNFMVEAALAGVSAIATDLFDPFLKNVVQIIHPDIAALEISLAKKFYDNPSAKLLTIGITGTNGKTTCSYLIKHLLDCFNKPCGLIGTIEWIIGDAVFPSAQTTPDALTNQKLFYDMVEAGSSSVVMEVSSHGLDQGRVAGVNFDLALFTNLTQDHLDYHQTMDAYAEAKALLFSTLKATSQKDKNYPKKAIINKDSPYASKMMEGVTVPILTYGLIEGADLRAEEIRLLASGTEYFVHYLGERVFFRSGLIGKFNVYNSLAAIAVGISLGFSLSKTIEVLSTFSAVPGRLERVITKSEKNIFVDYAHTEDALKNVLETLREVVTGKILCVFGCGGNRDRTKRPKMGLVAEALSDEIVVTSDNPRGEVPELIIEEILSLIRHSNKVTVEVDRRLAIAAAVKRLNPGDALLIAGKGHENYQIFSQSTIHFDDRIVAKEYSE